MHLRVSKYQTRRLAVASDKDPLACAAFFCCPLPPRPPNTMSYYYPLLSQLVQTKSAIVGNPKPGRIEAISPSFDYEQWLSCRLFSQSLKQLSTRTRYNWEKYLVLCCWPFHKKRRSIWWKVFFYKKVIGRFWKRTRNVEMRVRPNRWVLAHQTDNAHSWPYRNMN
jgi:hypothetical protein